ncbi:MAG: glycine/sarcosine/betaine reductase complex component C subunit beta [Syntrophobacteraceae bacterium]
MADPIVKATACVLVHVPSFVRHGSKPTREIAEGADPVLASIEAHLRSFEDAVAYPPNQVFIGNLHPDRLNDWEKPWTSHLIQGAAPSGPFGAIVPETAFIGLLKAADEFDLVWLDRDVAAAFLGALQGSPFWSQADLEKRILPGVEIERIREKIATQGSLPLYLGGRLIGCIHRHHDQDESLTAPILLENLMAKTSGVLALKHLMVNANCTPEDIDFILSCSEEAVGDRYNRGGGSLSKAIGEMCGCIHATGCDIKAFCVGPVYAIVHAASLIKAGICKRVAVVGGGCLAKLGMKFKGHVASDMPILEDVLGAIAFLVTEDDGETPIIRLDSIGKHTIGSGSSQQSIMEALVLHPLERMGMKVTDVDKYATELHNPEVTVPSGSGNVPLNNYRMIAALAVLRKEIDRSGIDAFVARRGMPGYAPTQGHIPAAVPFLGHAIADIKSGKIQNAMFLAKGSLFLGRMSQLSDGLSFLLEKNPRAR